MRNILGIVAGFGLLTVEGKEHRQMRRAMNPAFGLQHLIARKLHPLPLVFSCVEGLVEVDMYYDSIERYIYIGFSCVV